MAIRTAVCSPEVYTHNQPVLRSNGLWCTASTRRDTSIGTRIECIGHIGPSILEHCSSQTACLRYSRSHRAGSVAWGRIAGLNRPKRDPGIHESAIMRTSTSRSSKCLPGRHWKFQAPRSRGLKPTDGMGAGTKMRERRPIAAGDDQRLREAAGEA